MDDITINITKNTRFESTKKVLMVNRKEPFEKLLSKIAKKLGMEEVKILYNSDGAQVEDASEIKDRETLYASQGEQFLPHDKVAGANSRTEEKTKVLKLGIIGPPAVGKSALTVRYTQKVFIDEYLPSFEDIYKKNIIIHGEQVEVDILDSSGLDELVVMRPGWFKEREAFVMVFALDSRGSFEALKLFHEQLLTFRANDNVPIVVVGNKADLEQTRAISREEGEKLAKSFNNADYKEASAKKDQNVTVIFETISAKLFDQKYKSNKGNSDKQAKCQCLLL
jgi:small GTP-binding protein